jgi:hypothetical protein
MSSQPVGGEPTLGELVAGASRDLSTLVRTELELAKAEMKESARNGATGGGLAAAAVGLLVMAGVLASFAAVYGLNQVLPVWASFLIVAGAYLLVAAILGFLAYRHFARVKGPERAIAQNAATLAALKPASLERTWAEATKAG